MYLLPVQRGYFTDFGLEQRPTYVAGDAVAIPSVLSGETDISFSSGMGTIFTAAASGTGLKVIASNIAKPYAHLYSRPDIADPKQLVGKTVGISAPRTLLHLYALAMFEQVGVDPNQVEFVNIGVSPDVYKAVVAGKVDAGISTVGFGMQAKADSVHVLINGAEVIPQFQATCVFTSDQKIREKRDVLVRTLAATAKGFRFINSPEARSAWVTLASSPEVGQPAPLAEFEWTYLTESHALRLDLGLAPEEIEYMQRLNVSIGNQQDICSGSTSALVTSRRSYQSTRWPICLSLLTPSDSSMPRA